MAVVYIIVKWRVYQVDYDVGWLLGVMGLDIFLCVPWGSRRFEEFLVLDFGGSVGSTVLRV